jgi:hypothetical protein
MTQRSSGVYLDQFINELHRFTKLFISSSPEEYGQICAGMMD